MWLSLWVMGCGRNLVTAECADSLTAAESFTCDVPGWDHREYNVAVPTDYDGSPIPVLLSLHGGGGNKDSEARTTCSDGDANGGDCLHDLGEREGFVVVYPNGHPGEGWRRNLRTWNAGGGVDNWRFVGEGAVKADVDDVQYVRDLLDDLESRLSVDTSRVYATGLSNGGAMSHRLACDLSDRIAAVAPVGGGMQLTTSGECLPSQPVALLHTHGTADPCWRFEGGVPDCPVGQGGLEHVSIDRTMSEWAAIKGCTGEPVESAGPDTVADDGITTTRLTWQGCDAPLELLKVEGGGHTFPDGHQYLRERVVGPVVRDFGAEELWAFLSQHRR